MLRASALNNETDIDIQCVNGNAASADKNIEFGSLLLAFAESIANGVAPAITRTREALDQVAGGQIVVEAAGVAANFQRMVRIADATGIGLGRFEQPTTDIRESLGINAFRQR